MRKITDEEHASGMKYCSFCFKREMRHVDAVWRDKFQNDACEDHKSEIERTVSNELENR